MKSSFTTLIRSLLMAVGIACLLPALASAYPDFSITQPSENTVVTAGQNVTVSVYIWGSVAGFKSITCAGQGDITQTINFPMSPPVMTTTRNFTYHVPSSASPGQTLSIVITVEDWVDGVLPTQTRHVVIAGGGPTPTPTPTPVTYPSVTIPSSIYQAVYDPKRDVLYVGNEASNRIDIIDVASRSVTGNVGLTTSPRGMDISADSDRLYVGLLGRSVAVINLNSHTTSQSISLAGVSTDPAEYAAFIATGIRKTWFGVFDEYGWGYVAELDMTDNSLRKRTDFGIMGGDLAGPLVDASADHRYVFMSESNISSSYVAIFDSLTTTVVYSAQTSDYCKFMSVSADGAYYLWSTGVYSRSWQAVATVPIPDSYWGGGIFLPSHPGIVAGFSAEFPRDETEEILFYDVVGHSVLQRIPGIVQAHPPNHYFMVGSDQGNVLFVIGEQKVFFVPINYSPPRAAARPSVWGLYR